MDSKFYTAAARGQIEPFNDYTEPLNLLLTPTKNTILHIHITQQPKGVLARASLMFIGQNLVKCPSLLLQTNNKGETLLHKAARNGHPMLVQFLIEWVKAMHEDVESGAGAAREMMRMENVDKETALHEAVRHCNTNVVRVLTTKDPDFAYSVNRLGETPIYLAVERGYRDIVLHILDTCTSPAFDGPNGRTALHEAVIRNNLEMTQKILDTKTTLSKEVDQQGWTPLHHASHFGYLSIVKLLLECDTSAAYIGDKNGMTPLHLAAIGCDKPEKVVFSILERCPDCHEVVDHKGRNILHFALLSWSLTIMDRMLGEYNMGDLINQKDIDGNTPLHLLATCCNPNPTLIRHPLVDKMAVNGSNSTPMDIILNDTNDHLGGVQDLTLKYMKKEGGYEKSFRNSVKIEDRSPKVIDVKDIEKAKTSHMVVAALVVTVTFTAGFTMPGGNDDKEGIAIMSRNGAFATFVVTNALALLLSTCALFFYFALDFSTTQSNRTKAILVNFAGLFIVLSIFLMLIAFTAAIFAVLQSVYLRVLICVITSFSILICYSPLKDVFRS